MQAFWTSTTAVYADVRTDEGALETWRQAFRGVTVPVWDARGSGAATMSPDTVLQQGAVEEVWRVHAAPWHDRSWRGITHVFPGASVLDTPAWIANIRVKDVSPMSPMTETTEVQWCPPRGWGWVEGWTLSDHFGCPRADVVYLLSTRVLAGVWWILQWQRSMPKRCLTSARAVWAFGDDVGLAPWSFGHTPCPKATRQTDVGEHALRKLHDPPSHDLGWSTAISDMERAASREARASHAFLVPEQWEFRRESTPFECVRRGILTWLHAVRGTWVAEGMSGEELLPLQQWIDWLVEEREKEEAEHAWMDVRQWAAPHVHVLWRGSQHKADTDA